jgi:alkylation response protein AidB-like acyl-CoA dehydrogenase
MDLTLSTEQRALRAGVSEYLSGRWTADRLRASAGDAGIGSGGTGRGDAATAGRAAEAEAVVGWKELAGLGVFGLLAPEAAGGMGLTLADAAIVLEELGAALVPGPLVPSVLAAGLVDGAVEGDAVVTVLDTAAGVPAVEHAGIATHLVVIDDDGLFLQPMSEVTAVPVEFPVDPLTPVAVLAGRPARPGGVRIGTAAGAAGWRLRGAVLTAALQVGVARGGLDLAVRYVKEREQFGRVIGSFQAVKHLLAESLARVELARAAVLSAAVIDDDPEAGDPAEAAAAAKLLADAAATAGGRTCIQVHGGMGFTWEVPAHLYLKRAWVQETAFGTADAHAAFLAGRLSADRTSVP